VVALGHAQHARRRDRAPQGEGGSAQ
jgi:hypothetical protein